MSLETVTLLVMLGEDLFSQNTVQTIFLVNPVAAAMDAAGSPAMRKYDIWLPHLKIMAVATIAMVAVTLVRVRELRRAE